MSALTQQDAGPPDASGWQDWPLAARRPADAHSVPVEDYLRDGQYVLRAELPGVDPERDIEVTVTRDILTVRAERPEDPAGRRHSEFRYGKFGRSIRLPAGADETRIQASYGHGVLEICVQLAAGVGESASHRIPVQPNQHIKPT
jgi:HSP20 family protein